MRQNSQVVPDQDSFVGDAVSCRVTLDLGQPVLWHRGSVAIRRRIDMKPKMAA